MSATSASVCLIYPELLGTYGDRGNAIVLAQRLRWRGHGAEMVEVALGEPLPLTCDVYVLGGGEDAPQTLATDGLVSAGFAGVIDRGAVVFAVCAGLQLIGRSFTAADGSTVPGVGLLDISTRPRGSRMIGELVVSPTAFELPRLTGFENHGGITELGAGVSPLGTTIVGHGNGSGGPEGAVAGRIVGTYLHGPALARNPALADLMLSWVVGDELLQQPLDDSLVDRLRAERFEAVSIR